MVKLITAKDVLPLRSLVLREGKPFEFCVFDGDDDVDTFHLGYIQDAEILSIASFMLKECPTDEGNAYQLRGMATHPDANGKGYGKAIISYAVEYLKNKEYSFLWCNAREVAVPFYLKQGFQISSEEFDIPGIGPHFQMKLNLKN